MQSALISLVAMCATVDQGIVEMEHSVKVWLNVCVCSILIIIVSISDVDECQNDTLNNCDDNADCFDTEGSFNCTCREGYTGTGVQCQGKEFTVNAVP